MAEGDVVGGGVGGLNTGDSGINDGSAGTGGGGGTGGGNSSSGVTATSGTSGSSGVDAQPLTDAELVENVVKIYLAASGLALAYEQLVPLYVDNKLGFAKLKKQYKKDNPDVDPDEIDKAVDVERAAAITAFTEDGSAKDELKKKYDDFKTSLATIQKDLSSITTEFAKTIGEAVMPTTIGLGAPNPVSISLKVINGITKIKKILDRVFVAMAVFIASAKALGLDTSDAYRTTMSLIATPLRKIQDIISKKEADPKYQENLALQNYLQVAKEEWPHGIANDITYEDIEEFGRDGILIKKKGGSTEKLSINIWPIEDPKDRQHIVYTLDWYTDYYSNTVNNESTARLLNKYEGILKYNDYLGWATKEFKKNYETLAESNDSDTTTYNSSSGTVTGTTVTPGGGSGDTTWKSNTGGLSGLDKKATK